MEIGISTGCLYPELTENSIRTLAELGFDRFEVFFNTFSELENDMIDRLRYYLDLRGARVVSVHPFSSSFESFLLFSSYERRFLDGVTFYERFFRAASRIGADRVILHGLNTTYSSTITDNEYFRRFALMQKRASEYGVRLLQENVNRFRSADTSFIVEMSRAIPDEAAFVCDVKQALRAGIDPVDMTEAMGNKLLNVHISDRTSDGRCVLPCCGCYDLRGFIAHLKGSGYDGDVLIEVYRTSFGELSELIRARDSLAEIIQEVRNADPDS